jgi:acyl-CoA reductase-like NAD-dependent aldehyde dehydrogenase
MQMYVNDEWVESPNMVPVLSPFSREVIDEAPEASPEQIETALQAAECGAEAMANLSGSERSAILHRAADLIEENLEDLARTVSLEEGKPLAEAMGEVGRSPDLLRLSAFEGTQIRGETLPVDAQAGVRGKMGFTMRVPCGIVVAITPFNYPVLLVVHKIGPALAAGNAVILKPAHQTPLTALKLTRLLVEAGLPAGSFQCLTGSGEGVGAPLCEDPRVRKISFTGSTVVGERITRLAGVKKLSLELGSNCCMVVMEDADLDQVATATVAGGYVNAGQVCISAQRVVVHDNLYSDFLDALVPKVEQLKVGDPLEEKTQLSAMISEAAAKRVSRWIGEAVDGGARLLTGGQRDGALMSPSVIADVKSEMKISCRELFGPAVAVTPASTFDEAIQLANDSRYGLATSIFTHDLNTAIRFAQVARSGMVMINWTPLWRADLMPYGGLKGSGIGREGPRYAVKEMTELKTVVIHGLDE